MRYGTLFNILGKLIFFLGLSLLLPLGWAVYYGEATGPFIWPILLSIFLGGSLFNRVKENGDIRPREGFAVVGLGWLVTVLIGVLPYLISGTFSTFSDAFFETMSGFSTTGASVLADIEGTDRSILFWRSLTHWLGGMGIMVLFISILGTVGPGGLQVFRAEVPGTYSLEKFKPRIKEMAAILWTTYVVISGAQTIALLFAGLDFFDATVHTFGTMATGGFSSYSASIGAFDNTVRWIITFFMFLAGVNFSLYYVALRRKTLREFWKSAEFRLYLGILVFFSIVMTLVLWGEGETITDTVFQVVSITTTTGFATADFAAWPFAASGILVFLMFIGGCAGSTGGSMKVGRHLILSRHAMIEMQRMVRPRRVLSMRIEGMVIPERVITNILTFAFIYLFLTAVSTIVVLTGGHNLVTSFSAVVACIGNIGPGLGGVGPTMDYTIFGGGYKIYLAFLMLIGRLEIFTILVLFLPNTWRR